MSTTYTTYTSCPNTQPHPSHPFRSIDRTIKECPGTPRQGNS